MPTTYDDSHGIVISEDAARGGVTGHHVRYVLGLGLTGITLAFIGLAIYFGYDTISQRMSNALAVNPLEVVRDFAPYAAIIIAGAALAALLLGVWNAVWGRDNDATQTGMRMRIVVQFALICVIMAILYLSTMGGAT